MELTELFERDFERIVLLREPRVGLQACVVVHDTRLGPAFGGIRRMRYPSIDEAVADALRLAAAMTLKCAVSGIDGGGAKTVIVDHDGLDRQAAYRAVGRCVEELGGGYFTGPDVGTTAEDLAEVARETDRVASAAACGPLAVPTACGVFAGIESVARRLGADGGLRGLHVAVQGLGAVGRELVELLAAAGARLTVADLRPELAEEIAIRCCANVVAPAEIAALACDVFAPCALGGVVTRENVDALRARAIAGSANNVLASPELDARLFARGIVHAPDFVISSGALIHGALFHLEGSAPPLARIATIGHTLDTIFERSLRDGRPPGEIALDLAYERLDAVPEQA